MKTFQALLRVMFDLIRKHVPGFGSKAKNLASRPMMGKIIISDIDPDDGDNGFDDELEGWVKLHHNPFFDNDNSDIDSGESIGLIE